MARIAFLGNFKVDYSTETHHAQTLESMGHTVYRLQETQANSEKVFKVACNSDLFIWVHTHGWNTPGRMGMEHVLKQLKDLGIPTMTYHLDLWFGLKRQDDLAVEPIYKHIQHFYTVDKLMADWFNENTNVKGHFLPAAVYDKEAYMHSQYDGEHFDHEIIFVGSRRYHPEYPYRPQLIDFLRETYGNKFLHVGGDGDTGIVRGRDLNRIYSKSKIAIGDTLNLNFNYPYYSSDRLFESTGRGGFTIYPRIEGITDWFEDGKEIVYYEHGNLQDLKSKIDYYLKNEDERETIRLAGHKNAIENHTYVNRWNSILKELKIGEAL